MNRASYTHSYVEFVTTETTGIAEEESGLSFNTQLRGHAALIHMLSS